MIGALRKRFDEARRKRQRKATRDRLMRERGFLVRSLDDEVPEAAPGLAAIREARAGGSFAAFAKLFEEAKAADVMLAQGSKLHTYLWASVDDDLGDDGPACDRALAPYEQWYAQTKSPLAAAALAEGLLATAFAYRGGGFADSVDDKQWALFDERLDRGRDVLGQTLKEGEGSTEWLWARYDYALHDCDNFDDFNAAFEQVWSRDRTNLTLCRTHGFRLLPRWMGRDARDLELFARRAAGCTQDRFGDGMYAMIYGHGYCVGAHEVGDTLADKALMKQGFEDFAARFSAPSILNRYASGMYFAEDYRTVHHVFAERMSVIVPELWLGDTRESQVEDALETYRVVC